MFAFDADDTLWDCQSHFERAMQTYARLVSPYADGDVLTQLYATERANMPILGFGTKAFTLSLIENAVSCTRGRVPAGVIGRIVALGKEVLLMPCTPLPEVADTLRTLRNRGQELALFTKGELLDQQGKLSRSGLAPMFTAVEIVADKTPDAYLTLCRHLGIRPDQLVMVGNSFKSDIAPALEIGARAVHIPFRVTWALEQSEEYDHPRLTRISRFSELLSLQADT